MKNLSYYLVLLLSFLANAQSAKDFTLDYEGYNLQIVSMAKDGKGNVVLAAKARFKNYGIKDSLKISANSEIDKYGIVLVTDEKFQVKKGWVNYNFFPAKVVYDAAKEQFWIGGSEQEYNRKRPKLFSHWQMVLLRVDAKKLIKKWHPVETDYACHLEDLVFDDKKLLCTAIKDTLSGKDRLETAMVFEFSPSQFHKAKYQPHFETPDVLNVTKASQSAAHVMLTAIDRAKDNLLFGATLLPFGRFPTENISVYKYENKQLVPETFEPAVKHAMFYFLTHFSVLEDGNLLLAYVTAAESKFYMLEKTDPYLQTIWQRKVDDLRYPNLANNEILEMPDGKIIAAAANKDKNWSYFVYGAGGELLREIDTGQSVKSYISFTQPWSEKEFVCSFYSLDKKPVPNKILVFATE